MIDHVTWIFSIFLSSLQIALTHLGRVTHICIGNLIIIASDNGLSADQCQAIIWTNAGIFLIRPLGTNFSEILIEILIFSFMKMHLKVSSAKWPPFCPGLNVLRACMVSWYNSWICKIFRHLHFAMIFNVFPSKPWCILMTVWCLDDNTNCFDWISTIFSARDYAVPSAKYAWFCWWTQKYEWHL